MVDPLSRLIEGPTYADSVLVLAGIVAYVGLFVSLEVAKSDAE